MTAILAWIATKPGFWWIVICSLNSDALTKSILMQSALLISLLFILLVCSMNSVCSLWLNNVANVGVQNFWTGTCNLNQVICSKQMCLHAVNMLKDYSSCCSTLTGNFISLASVASKLKEYKKWFRYSYLKDTHTFLCFFAEPELIF